MEISSQNGTSDLVYRHYSYVNAMETTATISYKWNNNTLKVSVYLKVYAYATAWNAYWARTEAQLTAYNFYFS
ncbi:hypothetical protein [Spiroplasma eriocheiris]|uniref:hypothetical protein n=1 Tax=Spiroplasma eriocheiris TaxID=315358 RepID=UPI0006496310|nr:hypothetical protein [Spiroplasma eriocheiris]AHF57836.1 hypothetical protein SPE_0714 [Spiroplasma eriocheiris CCTCC M 207170]